MAQFVISNLYIVNLHLPYLVLFGLLLSGCRMEPDVGHVAIFSSHTENSHTGNKTFYNFSFTLTPANSTTYVPIGYRNPDYRPESVSTVNGNGGFEVFIRKAGFPIRAPGCDGDWIILRMPNTDGVTNEVSTGTKIGKKVDLWKRLQRMYQTKKESQRVVIELSSSEYVHVTDAAAPTMELEYCNVFFRTAYGAYISYVGQIKKADAVVEPRPTQIPN